MLSHYGMNHANGIYSMAYRIVDIATIPIFSIRDAAMPRFFKLGREGIAASADLSNRLLRRTLALGAVVALACPACASKDKVASGQGVGMGAGMAPPPLTAAYDPAKQMGSGSAGSPWGSPGGGMPSSMPTAAANGSSFNR
jgi:hypothetical protein